MFCRNTILRVAAATRSAEFQSGSAMIVLEPDVAAAFPNASEMNELLRAVASAMRKTRTPKRARRAPTKRSA